MNTRQLQYAVLLAQARNFSQVAEELGISQPGLSKHIINLEQELGVKLFDRNTSPLTLTPAGEHFIREVKELLLREDALIRSMEDFKAGDTGRLSIGVSPFRSIYLMPGIIGRLREQFPGLRVTLHECVSDQLLKRAAEGQFDLAIMNLPVDEALFEVTPMETETSVLVVPDGMVPLIPREAVSPGEKYDVVDLSACSELPFVVLGDGQEMRRTYEALCAIAEVRPNIAAQVINVATAWAMAQAGVGATLAPLQFVQGGFFSKGVSLFELKQNTFLRRPVVALRRGQYVSKYARYAIELLCSPRE